MHKLPDWQSRLSALVAEAHTSAKFTWGKMDCCMWAAAAVEAQTGVDLAEEFRGKYADADGAARLMRELRGLRGIGARVGPEVRPLMAQHGDIGIVRGLNRKPVMGVFSGAVWLIVTAAGMAVVPPTSAIKVWRVGNA